jgi:hypothetical protein
MISELSLPKPGGHVLSPYFDRARSGPWSKMGLEGSRDKACKLGPVRKMEAIRPCKLGISS